MNWRLALAAVALIVVVAVFVALVALRGDGDPVEERAPTVPKITQADSGNSGNVDKVTRRAGAATADAMQDLHARPRAVTDYMVGDARVRDHRSGERAPIEVPPAVHAPGGRKIPSQLTSAIAQEVRVAMAACAASLPATARGSAPRLDGTIAIAIRAGKATITSARVQLREVERVAAAAIEQCIEQRSVAVTASAGDEADVEDYPVTLAFRLP